MKSSTNVSLLLLIKIGGQIGGQSGGMQWRRGEEVVGVWRERCGGVVGDTAFTESPDRVPAGAPLAVLAPFSFLLIT